MFWAVTIGAIALVSMRMGRPISGLCFLASYGSELFIGTSGFPFSPGVLLSVNDGLLLRVMYAGSRRGPRVGAAAVVDLTLLVVDDGGTTTAAAVTAVAAAGGGATPLRGLRLELDGTLPRLELPRRLERSSRSSRTRSSRLE